MAIWRESTCTDHIQSTVVCVLNKMDNDNLCAWKRRLYCPCDSSINMLIFLVKPSKTAGLRTLLAAFSYIFWQCTYPNPNPSATANCKSSSTRRVHQLKTSIDQMRNKDNMHISISFFFSSINSSALEVVPTNSLLEHYKSTTTFFF